MTYEDASKWWVSLSPLQKYFVWNSLKNPGPVPDKIKPDFVMYAYTARYWPNLEGWPTK